MAKPKNKKTDLKNISRYILHENSKVKIVSDPDVLDVGRRHEGWTLVKKYRKLNLWLRRCRNGEIIRECFSRYEIPKRVNVFEEGS